MIKTYCGECDAQSIDGITNHKKSCSANLFFNKPSTDYLRPPSQVIKFDSPEEQEEFMRKLRGDKDNG